jgi:hypothetical protein
MAKYIFQREGSAHWWIKLRSGGKRIEQSLGTSDRREAEILALPMIAEHKTRLLAARPRIEKVWRHRFEPGRLHVGEDGARIFATDRELTHFDADGTTATTEPNGGLVPQFVVGARSFSLGGELDGKALGEAILSGALPTHGLKAAVSIFGNLRPASLAKRNGDDALFETYIHHANITGYY